MKRVLLTEGEMRIITACLYANGSDREGGKVMQEREGRLAGISPRVGERIMMFLSEHFTLSSGKQVRSCEVRRRRCWGFEKKRESVK